MITIVATLCLGCLGLVFILWITGFHRGDNDNSEKFKLETSRTYDYYYRQMEESNRTLLSKLVDNEPYSGGTSNEMQVRIVVLHNTVLKLRKEILELKEKQND